MKKNVLVFPCGSEIGLEIYKSISFSTHFKLVGGSSVDDHGLYVYEDYIGGLPFVDDSEFIDKINEIIVSNNIDCIFPAHDSVVLKLAQESAAGRLKCDVVTSNLETCAISRSKVKTYKHLENIIPTAKVYQSVEFIEPEEYPVFLKPDVGQGSKGVQIAATKADVLYYIDKDPTLMILEYLPGVEYTVDCFTDRHGKLRFFEGRKRNRIMGGISVNSSKVSDARFGEIAKKINENLEFRGAWFFQLKENSKKELILLEIAPRIAGTMGLVRCKGVNLALLSLFDKFNNDISIIENNYHLVIDRALHNLYKHNIKYSHVYIDYDDLVIFEGKANPVVVKFLYQCINKKIKTHLITRHKGDLTISLKINRLTDVFDEVIWIKNVDPKYLYINEKDSIFIDDSHAERSAVHDHLNIPVFDAHMIDSLMEKD